ncbi:MAG: hypothetical protein ACK4E3_10640 [Brevundimonas sp.]|uniref:hypothetical protein n=1 Tax=Brevundimonas sp. TaxID=1871086 RepID=UPI00391C6AA3
MSPSPRTASRTPAAHRLSGLRIGLKWRDGRPRWEPSPSSRRAGIGGVDLREADGTWMSPGRAVEVAEARCEWAAILRDALGDDADRAAEARAVLGEAIANLPPVPVEPERARVRVLIGDLIDRARALADLPPEQRAKGARTVAALCDAYLADAEAMAALRPASQKIYCLMLAKLKASPLGTMPADQVTRADMRAWYLDLIEAVSISTANVALGAAGAAFRWGTWQRPAWVSVSPCERLGRRAAPGRLVFWTREEEEAFVTWCDANGFEDVADCLTLCLWTGARQSDVCAASLDDLSGDTWRYLPIKTARGGREALPGLLEPVRRRVRRRRDELARELAAGAPPRIGRVPMLWHASTGAPHGSRSISLRFRTARTAALAAGAVPASVADRQLRDARDTCLTRLFDATSSIDRLCAWTGHARADAESVLRRHYVTLQEGGAMETARSLERWASAQGFAVLGEG